MQFTIKSASLIVLFCAALSANAAPFPTTEGDLAVRAPPPPPRPNNGPARPHPRGLEERQRQGPNRNGPPGVPPPKPHPRDIEEGEFEERNLEERQRQGPNRNGPAGGPPPKPHPRDLEERQRQGPNTNGPASAPANANPAPNNGGRKGPGAVAGVSYI